MFPATSVIFFTTASGAGYGLIAALGVFAALGLVAPGLGLGLFGFVLAFGLITAGLLSSTFHLGHPERAWRAVSQWRSSWLSREGVMALVTYVPAGLFALVFTFGPWLPEGQGALRPLGLLSALAAALTVFSTGMIYRVLKPIHQWANGWVVPSYLALAAMTGLMLLDLALAVFARPSQVVVATTLIAIALAAALKVGYWRFIRTSRAASTAETATGLGRFGRVRLLEAPHTEENYLLKEMGFKIARRHAEKLRRIAALAGFILPFVFTLTTLVRPAFGLLPAVLAVLSAGLGVAVERWLFFAEAKHTVTLYYGATSV